MSNVDGARTAGPSLFERPWLVAALYTALTLPMAYPLSLHPASMTLPGTDQENGAWLKLAYTEGGGRVYALRRPE